MAGSTLLKDEKERRKKVFLVGALVAVAVLLMAPQHTLIYLQHLQTTSVSNEMGASAQANFSSTAGALSNAIFNALHISALTASATGFLHERLVVGVTGAYIIVWRAVYFIGLSLIVLPLFVAAITDGLVRRRIAQWRYEYTSIARHYMARSTAGWLIDALLLCVMLPIPLPPIVMITWYVIIGISLRWWAASLQKRM